MKKEKEKQRILKVRPFNMANFSGGSGYLVFSIVYQALAILPAMVIIWLASLIKLPKLDESGEIDCKKAVKRYNIVAVPLCVIIAIIGLIFAYVGNYGTFGEYWIEIFLVGLAPAICLYFIVRFCHRRIIERKANVVPMIVLSVFLTVFALAVIYLLCICLIDPILSDFALS